MGTEEEGGILPDVLTGDGGTGGIHEAGRVSGQGKKKKKNTPVAQGQSSPTPSQEVMRSREKCISQCVGAIFCPISYIQGVFLLDSSMFHYPD